jgi:hypothetical protein
LLRSPAVPPRLHGQLAPLLDRRVVALFVALLAGAFYFGGTSGAGYDSDLDQVWVASRALLRGVDPYSVVGPGLEADQRFPLYYPLPAVIAFLPLAVLPLALARAVFVGASAGLLAYAVSRRGWHLVPIFVSGAFATAYVTAQWSPLLAAAVFLPWLGPVFVMKPNIGAAIVAATPSRSLLAWTAGGGTLLTLISFLIDPVWLHKWLGHVQDAPHFTPPVLLPGGVLVLIALLRWRRPEARLIVALACVPHTTLAYESLPVLLAARNWKQAGLLAVLSLSTFVVQNRIAPAPGSGEDVYNAWVTASGTWIVLLVYIPATIMVLLRPNVGEPPAWAALMAQALRLLKRIAPHSPHAADSTTAP